MACQHQYLTGTSCCVAVTVKVSTSSSLCIVVFSGLQCSSLLLSSLAWMFGVPLTSPDLFLTPVFCLFWSSLLSCILHHGLRCGQPSRNLSMPMQTSHMFLPFGKTQSLRTFSPLEQFFIKLALHPVANLHSTFPQPSSLMPNLRLSNLNLFLPFSPSSKLIHLAYFSVTACQCGCSCPRPVLRLSIDCSILVKSSLFFPYITLIAPLSPSTSLLACRTHSNTAAVL